MGYYIRVLEMALTYFPVVSAVFILPYLVVQYRRYGRIHSWHVVINLLAVYYVLTVFCLVNLPFPDSMDYAPKEPQLKLFAWFQDLLITQQAIGSWSPLAVLSNSVIYQQLFNVLMFVPLGVYMRYVRKQRLWVVFVLALIFSLLLEVIQLSGFFFLFSGAYRFFDVDDLFTNVLGALLGFYLGRIPEKYYPLEQRHSPSVMGDISTFPKVLGAAIDTLAVVAINQLLFLLFTESLAIALATGAAYFIGLPCATNGITLGRYLLQIKLIPAFGRNKQIVAGDIILKHLPLLLSLVGYYFFTIKGSTMPTLWYTGFLGLFLITIGLYWGLSFMKKEQLFFDKWSGLRLCPKYRQKPLR